jgi:hypothetical protein
VIASGIDDEEDMPPNDDEEYGDEEESQNHPGFLAVPRNNNRYHYNQNFMHPQVQYYN